MPIIGAFILPHGALTLTPSKFPEMKELELLHFSSYSTAEEIYSLKPDIILLTTPHGISLTQSYGIYLNTKAKGDAEWLGNWKEFTVEVEIAQEEAKDILKILDTNKLPSEGILSFSEGEATPLRWGEVIPLWFIQQPYKNYSLEPIPFPKCIIISMPRKRVTQPEMMIKECLDIGAEIFKYFESSDKRVVVISSGDLAHTHKVNMKTIDNDQSDDEAEIFDKAMQLWAMNPIENEEVLLNASEIVTKYLSCGYTGFVLLHGILKEINKTYTIVPKVLCNTHPSYYGMMVVKFLISK